MSFKTAISFAALLAAFASPAFSFPQAAIAVSTDGNVVLPFPRVVVAPARIPAGYENATVELRLVVDTRGRPQRVETLNPVPVEVRELVVGAVKKWTFEPATRGGNPVSVAVILPLKLAVSDGSPSSP